MTLPLTAPAPIPFALPPGAPPAPRQRREVAWRIAFTLVCGAHAATLWWLAVTWHRAPALVSPPAVTGVLVSAPEPLPVVAPPQPEPTPRPEPKPRPKPKAKPKPKPIPVPEAPPSERAVAAPPPEPETAEPPAPPPAPAAPILAEEPAEAPPLIPPRTDAAHLNNPAPVYPPLSRRLNEQGRVLLDVYILPDGSVGEIRLKRSSGYARLDNAALEAVRRWRYVPARRGDEPIPYWYVQPILFELND